MTKKNLQVSIEPTNDEAGQDRFPVPFTLEQFRNDILWMYFLHVRLIESLSDHEAALRFLGKPSPDGYIVFENPAQLETELGFTYEDIRNSWLARSLESMYRYAYHGELDDTVEELGPGGYHIGIAAIVRDMAGSSNLKFNLWSAESETTDSVRYSVENCLRTVELANARLTLEGQSRIFNFDSKDEDFDNLISGGTIDTPQGGYGAALTVRQMALLSGMGELSIRTLANPKRSNQIPTETRFGRTLVPIDAAKTWLKSRNRYVSIRHGVDGAALNLIKRRFVSMRELHSVVQSRLSGLGGDVSSRTFHELASRHGFMSDDMTVYGNGQFVRELAVLLMFPVDMFALRVKEALLVEELAEVRRQVMDAVRGA